MATDIFRKIRTVALIFLIASILSGCVSSARGKYFGKTVAPADNILHYVSGPEPESLDPQLPDLQPEARIQMALYEGLVEYNPKDQQPIPALAKSWEISPAVDEFLFHIRDSAKWSDGTPITARDFVYSLHRGFAPETISRTASLGFFIKYSEALKSGRVFAKKGDRFVLEKDVAAPAEVHPHFQLGPDTEFNRFITSPARITLDGDETKRQKEIAADPKLAAAVLGAEFVPVKAEDIGVEAVDDYTVRISLRQSAPFFLGLLAHQFFRLVPQAAIEKWGKSWTKPEHIITCGPFRVKAYRPYDALILEKDPNYWDAANVRLEGIDFYAVEENATTMNLYRAGEIDAFLNHAVPASWISEVRPFKDEYVNFPENATAYYAMNMNKAPFNDVRVRKAFNLGLDHEALSNYKKIMKPLFDISPAGIFPDYDKARAKVSEEVRIERGIAADVWAKNKSFDAEGARRLLTSAGFPVQKNGDGYSCPNFPSDKVSLTFNTNENNRATAEFVQAQWKQNLGITVPLKTMEFKTYAPFYKGLQYEGFAQSLWSGDYMDPYTFLSLHYGKGNEGGTGFYDPKFDKMLDEANTELDTQKRYDEIARAEFYLMEQLPSVPLMILATNWMKKPYVKGMYPNPGTLFPWKFVYIEHDPAKWDHDVENIMSEADPQVEKQLRELTGTQKIEGK